MCIHGHLCYNPKCPRVIPLTTCKIEALQQPPWAPKDLRFNSECYNINFDPWITAIASVVPAFTRDADLENKVTIPTPSPKRPREKEPGPPSPESVGRKIHHPNEPINRKRPTRSDDHHCADSIVKADNNKKIKTEF